MLPQTQKIKVRVMFSKTGSLKFISHLDLNRTVRSAFLRSKLPIWYTKGYNPHPKTVFSLPLSVGTSSLTEFMDFAVVEPVSGEEICNRLNAVFPAGLRALEAYMPATSFHDVGWADYEVRLMIPNAAEWEGPVKHTLAGEMLIEKTGKAGTKTLDIAPLTKVLAVFPENEELVLRLRLSAETESYVNPKYVIDYLTKTLGIPGEKDDYTVCRTAVYRKDGETSFR